MTVNYRLSAHLLIEHAERYNAIKEYIGIGKISYKIKDRDSRMLLITDTGIIMIAKETTIVTMYVLKIDKATVIFKGKIPNEIYSAILKNGQLNRDIKRKLNLH